ncbi:hypothetical protein RhiJN_25950 [Ceratobasidium sp. AG-Ba]|nr:hypothetical protein RhiJN_25950 [Ceratobasidium sp. AG-Ba]
MVHLAGQHKFDSWAFVHPAHPADDNERGRASSPEHLPAGQRACRAPDPPSHGDSKSPPRRSKNFQCPRMTMLPPLLYLLPRHRCYHKGTRSPNVLPFSTLLTPLLPSRSTRDFVEFEIEEPATKQKKPKRSTTGAKKRKAIEPEDQETQEPPVNKTKARPNIRPPLPPESTSTPLNVDFSSDTPAPQSTRVLDIVSSSSSVAGSSRKLIPVGSSDPPKGVAGAKAKTLKAEFDSNNSEWTTLTAYVRDAVVEVVEPMVKVGPSDRITQEKLEKLHLVILKAIGEVAAEKAMSDSERLQRGGEDHEKITRMKLRLSDAINVLKPKQDALMATQVTVEAYRGLVAKKTETYTPGLASSLQSLSGILSEGDHKNEALQAVVEAV